MEQIGKKQPTSSNSHPFQYTNIYNENEKYENITNPLNMASKTRKKSTKSTNSHPFQYTNPLNKTRKTSTKSTNLPPENENYKPINMASSKPPVVFDNLHRTLYDENQLYYTTI